MTAKIFLIVFFIPLVCFSNIVVSGPLSYVYSGKHGDKVEGQIRIYNQSEKPQRVMLKFYDCPYYSQKDQGYIYPEVGSDARSNAHWFNLEKNIITLAGLSSYDIPIKGVIPSGKDHEGSYYSILMVEPELEDKTLDKEKPMVRSLVRYALHIVTTIEGTGTYDLKILKKEMKKEKDKKTFEFEVENTGSNYFRPDVVVELYSESGEKIEPFKMSPVWLFPSKTKTYSIDISNLKKGKYQGLILFDQKGADFFGSKCEFEIQ